MVVGQSVGTTFPSSVLWRPPVSYTHLEFKQEGWGRDQRYKFLMTYADGSIQYWGTKNTTDSNHGAATPEDPYFYIMETPDNQWDQKWKLNDEFRCV